ncbi:hypothetical protein [Alkalinema sp. FACHB-956]|uniref:hypothetical protein n=1 Tax=Alkalinema sp. FACHB-956 TaxID=2692768 RepID=UPI00168217B6|nr:hypothetical protein [Alkalinema sp. FACHB-956]MBD2328407.1 hypothetical protein [Alkalinema sp. FACHB-956]
MDQLSFIPEELVRTLQQDAGNEDTRCSSSTLEMLRLLASLDVPKELLACMLEMAEFSIHHVRYLAGPLVLHRSLWSDVIPSWLKVACVKDRFDLILSEYEQDQVGDYATPTEVLTYMMPASFEAPMHRDYSDLYIWAGNEVMRKHNKLPKGADNFYELISGHPIEFSAVKNDFQDLSRSIRQSVVKHAAQQGWGKRRNRAKAEAISADPAQVSDQPEQVSLF